MDALMRTLLVVEEQLLEIVSALDEAQDHGDYDPDPTTGATDGLMAAVWIVRNVRADVDANLVPA